MATKKAVSITYCRPCGYEKRAAAAAAALKQELGIVATLIPGGGGIFKVEVGDQIAARRSKGHFPGPEEIVAAVAMALKMA